ALVLGRVVMNNHSESWFPRKASPRKMVMPTQSLAERRLRRSMSKTAFCIVKLDETSTTVKQAARIVSRWVPAGGQTVCSERMVKNAANSPLKNISSEPSQIMTPMASIGGRSWVMRGLLAGSPTEIAWLTGYLLLDGRHKTPTCWWEGLVSRPLDDHGSRPSKAPGRRDQSASRSTGSGR